MSDKIYYPMDDILGQIEILARKIEDDNFKPDIIVGLTRGGLVPAVFLSHRLNVPMSAIDLNLRDKSSLVENESAAWIAELAYGYEGGQKRILIVDDINDSGATMQWIADDWEAGCFPGDERWEKSIWHGSTRFACLINNSGSKFDIDYWVDTVHKDENELPWIVFPWEVDD